MTILEISHIGLWVVAILIAPLCIALVYLLSVLEQHSESLQESRARASSIKVGEIFPNFTLRDLASGLECESVDLFNGRQRIFLCVQSGCSACAAITSELQSWSARELARLGLVIVCFSSDEVCMKRYGDLESVPILRGGDDNSVLANAGLPAVFVVAADARVLGVYVGATSLRAIVDKLSKPGASLAPPLKPVVNEEIGL